jgi:tripartite-type tricarboxylate transporter receptor subunit TctC
MNRVHFHSDVRHARTGLDVSAAKHGRMIRGLLPGLILAAAALTTAIDAGAQTAAPAYPTQPIHMVVPFTPGGSTDVMARVIGNEVSKTLGQPVIVDNKPGANSNLGASYVAHAAPDGYTLLVGTTALTTNPSLYKSLSYSIVNDLVGVANIAAVPLVLVVPASLPANNLKELVDYAKKSTTPLNFASTGSGSVAHLAGELLKRQTGIDMAHIPYKGAAPAVAALLGGQVQMMFDTPTSSLPFITSGKLKAIVTTGLERSAVLKDIQTVKESGVADFDIMAWTGVLAPKGTPPAVVAKLHAQVEKALELPDVVSRFNNLGLVIVKESQPAFAARIRSDVDKWAPIVKASGARLD